MNATRTPTSMTTIHPKIIQITVEELEPSFSIGSGQISSWVHCPYLLSASRFVNFSVFKCIVSQVLGS